MSIFDKFKDMAGFIVELEEQYTNPFGVQIDRIISPTEGIINGNHTILAGTNNYLGLTFDPDCIEATHKALDVEGTGTTGSRMANGSYSAHRLLEKELSEFYGMADAVVFSTGYLANLGMLSTLAGPNDIVLLDADCHASIYDGCKLGGAKTRRFKHNDVADLEKRLIRLGDRAGEALIVIESLYSMLGDLAPLKEIVDMKNKYGCYLMVDEAHSLGIMGSKGIGLAEKLGLIDEVDFIVGTFSKSLGTAGGYCVSNHKELDVIRYVSRPYIFTASPSPTTIAATRQALKSLAAGDHLRKRLYENANQLHAGLRNLGYKIAAAPSPVIAVVFGSKDETLEFWENLLRLGVYVNLMIPPATPKGAFLIRCSVSAAHTPEQVNTVIEAFAELRVTA